MSDLTRFALVAEGPTDLIVIEAALQAILVRDFVITQLQPESSEAFGPLGGGWGGVYRWCKQTARNAGGSLHLFEILLREYDALILHLDADVARSQYADVSITPDAVDGMLPCEEPCPPVQVTTNRLRNVLLSWCGETVTPPKIILCTPSKSTDTWVVASLFPTDAAVLASSPFECHASPDSRFSQQAKRRRIVKSKTSYRNNFDRIVASWSSLTLYEATRFRTEVLETLDVID